MMIHFKFIKYFGLKSENLFVKTPEKLHRNIHIVAVIMRPFIFSFEN